MGALAVLFDRLGPYHVARISAAAAAFPTVAVEFGADSEEYAWDRVATDPQELERHTISPRRARDLSYREFGQRLFGLLDRLEPSAIAIPGWLERGSLLALRWAVRRQTPVVMMSASQRDDAPRLAWRELIKSRVVRLCGAGLVGGRRHVSYLRELGMPEHAIFTGYDVVDNDHFARGAERARAMVSPPALGLPSRYLLASSRFVAKKNLDHLLRAYADYRRELCERALPLVLLGDGPLRDELTSLRRELELDRNVVMPGFVQYEELPTYYGLATALVHVSTNEQWGLVVNEAAASGLPLIVSRACGCAPELVEPGSNGYLVDPHDRGQLVEALRMITEQPPAALRAMGGRSVELVARWSPSVFASRLAQAVDVARARRQHSASVGDRALLTALAAR